MFRLIARLQQKSDSQKRRFALIWSLILTGIIVGVWATTFSFRTNPDPEIGHPEVGPLDSIMRGFEELFN